MALEPVGVEAVIEGLNSFLRGMGQMNDAVEGLATTFENIAEETSGGEILGGVGDAAETAGDQVGGLLGGLTTGAGGLSNILGGLTSSLTTAAGGAGGLVAAIGGPAGLIIGLGAAVLAAGAAKDAIEGLVNTVVSVGTAIFNLAVDAAPLVGILESFQRISAQTGISLDELRQAAQGTVADIDLLRLANFSLAQTSGELSEELGAALPQLLQIARTAARATGEDVTFLFDSLVRGIRRGSPLIIDNALLTITLAEANQEYADSLGVTVDELTSEQEQLAILNATLARGDILIEQFGGNTLTAADQLARFRAGVQNVRDGLGLFLQPALAGIAAAGADFLTFLTEAISEGGALVPVLANVGATLSILADMFRTAVNIGIRFVENFNISLNEGFADAVTNAAVWGAEIVSALAEGMIRAASSVLVVAMEAIGRLLTFWLAPGSPPRVAPDLDAWGAEAFTEYLRGFEDADFGILSNLQQFLRPFLTDDEFLGISESIAQALTTGTGQTDLFAQLAASAGDIGPEIAHLAELQFALASATDAAAAAQDALNRAQQDIKTARGDIARLTMEYNDLLRAGASDDVLQAQLASINAAEENLTQAEQQAIAAAAQAEEQQNNANILDEQVKLQQQLIQQLVQISQQQQQITQEQSAQAAGATGGASSLAAGIESVADSFAGLGDIAFDVQGTIANAIELAREEILERLGTVFEPLRERWEESILPMLDFLQMQFLIFKKKVIVFIENLTREGRNKFDNILLPALQRIGRFLTETILPLFKALDRLIREIITAGIEALGGSVENLITDFSALFKFLDETFGPFIAEFVAATLTDFERILGNIEFVIGLITEGINFLADSIDDIVRLIEFLNALGEVVGGGGGFQRSVPGAGRVAAPVTAGRGGDTIQINLGGQTITNGVDAAAFQALVEQAVRRALQR